MPPRPSVIVRNKIKIKIHIKIKISFIINFVCFVHNDERFIAKFFNNQIVDFSLLSTQSTCIGGNVTSLPGRQQGMALIINYSQEFR